ncbi:MAG: hypothetical protein NC548_05935 [Lachnospiraceae bacterium]|nr:hypothetical protein [Lachnospiraceae bacterium]
MNVKFVPTKDQQLVEIFVDGAHLDTRNVSTDETGHKYIHVPNLFRQNGSVLEKFSFRHRVGDMVTHIRNGWGDCIQVTHLLVRSESLVWFLDREYGDTMRQKSLEGWKGTEFKWAVFETNRTFGDCPVNVRGELVHQFIGTTVIDADDIHIQYYDTEKDAQAFINGILDELRPITEQYKKLVKENGCGEAEQKFYADHLAGLTGIRETVWLRCADDKSIDEDCCLYTGQIVRKTNCKPTTIKVYREDYFPESDRYMCRGDAIDQCVESHIYVTEESFVVSMPIEELFTEDKPERYIYRAEVREECAKWYTSVQDCFDGDDYSEIEAMAKRLVLPVYIRKATLHKQENQPIEVSMEHPYQMLLCPGKRGLVGRANLRPDESGRFGPSRGKMYFPDRRCADKLCAGMVSVKSVNDRGNYGFIMAEMVKYTAPSEEGVAKWLITSNRTYASFPMRFVKNTKWGSAVSIVDKREPSNVLMWIAVTSDGSVDEVEVLKEYDHSDDVILEEVDSRDFICTGYTDKTYSELCEMVPFIQDIWRLQTTPSIKFINDDFDDAVHCGLIEILRFNSFDICIVHNDKMCTAAELLQRNLIPVLKEARKINEEAKNRLASMRRKGKLK